MKTGTYRILNKSTPHISFNANDEHLTDLIRKLDSSIEWQDDIIQFAKEWINKLDHIVVKTSGSTGLPKEISLKKNHVISSAQLTNEHFKLNQHTVAYNPLPMKFIAGKLMLIRALVGAYELDFCEPTLELQPLRNIYDFCPMTALQVSKSFDTLKTFKTVIIGGGKLPDELKNKISKLDTEFFETFGMTETITHVASKHISSKEFKAIGSTKFWANENGQLIIKAPHIGIKEIVTNDAVDLIDTRSFIWLSRIDDVVNTGGIKIYPEQLENKIRPMMDRPFFLTKKQDKALGEKLIMVIEGAQLDQHSMKLLKSELNESLDKYEVPKEIVFVSEFVYTETGKLIKRLN